jgi:pyridoxal phosphate enzyme (YggS family)
VSKTVEPERIRQAFAAGQRVFGENRVQEARGKQPDAPPGAQWHLVGHLQRNKAREAARIFRMIHSVDSLELLRDLDRHAAGRSEALEVLIQVNLAAEAAKHGARPGDLPEILAAGRDLRHIKVAGLMLIPPYHPDPEFSRPLFRELADLARELSGKPGEPASLRELSMGMSEDFEVAVEEGATLVRIGRALFGERPLAVQKEPE